MFLNSVEIQSTNSISNMLDYILNMHRALKYKNQAPEVQVAAAAWNDINPKPGWPLACAGINTFLVKSALV